MACLTPSTSTHAIVLALHELRPVAGVAPSALSAETAVEALRVAGPSTVEIVRELGAGHALDDSLASAFPDQSIRFEGAVPPPEWSWRLSESTGRGLLKALHSLPLRERPVVLRRLLFPDRAALAASGRLADTRGALWGFYLKRIARSVRSLFKAARS